MDQTAQHILFSQDTRKLADGHAPPAVRDHHEGFLRRVVSGVSDHGDYLLKLEHFRQRLSKDVQTKAITVYCFAKQGQLFFSNGAFQRFRYFFLQMRREHQHILFLIIRVFIHKDESLRGSLSIKGEAERREEMVGMFSMSLSASRRGRSMSMDAERYVFLNYF